MKNVIEPYTITLPNGDIKSGYNIVYLDNNNQEITREEYYGVSAEGWLTLQNYSSVKIQALSRYEQKILMSGKELGPKMAAVRDWLEGILLSYTTSNTSQFEWSPAPYTFEEVSTEAINTLSL
jgi:hypothetical protein